MRTFVLVSFVGGCLGVLVRALVITVKDYPRSLTYSKGEDVLYLLLSVGVSVWAGVLLFA
jgi:hypothetical protein